MRKLPKELEPLPEHEWPQSQTSRERLAVWRSRDYLVQVFAEDEDIIRLSICRTQIGGDGRWEDGLSWDELQRVKREIMLGDSWAMEIYPADDHIVNVANMRHLWVMQSPPTFGWRNG